MATKTAAVTVGTTPTRLDAQTDADRDGQFVGQICTYYNAGAVDVWLGDVTVVAGAGIKLAAGVIAAEQLPPNSKRYAIVTAGTCQVNVDQVGV